MGWVSPLHGDARTLCRVGDEARELVERPSSDQAVVFAGFRPTAGACRAPADTGEPFQADDAHLLLLGMEDDLVGELMVHVAHPARLVALALAHGANLLRLLQLLAAGGGTAAPCAPAPAHCPQTNGLFPHPPPPPRASAPRATPSVPHSA